jgi:transcriptional regulator with XRE-family HTH domain
LTIPTPKQLLLQRLSAAVVSGSVTQQHIAEATGVHQSQISRILSGQVVRDSPNVARLCEFAETLKPQRLPAPFAGKELTDTVLRIWDGTPGHAAALRKLLEAVGETQRTYEDARES